MRILRTGARWKDWRFQRWVRAGVMALAQDLKEHGTFVVAKKGEGVGKGSKVEAEIKKTDFLGSRQVTIRVGQRMATHSRDRVERGRALGHRRPGDREVPSPAGEKGGLISTSF